jgi:hypothetical protein
MLDALRDRITAYLAAHGVCVLSTQGAASASAVLARYHLAQDTAAKQALEVDCLLPRWADATYHLELNPQVLLIIPDIRADGLRWLQVRGRVRPIPAMDWAEWLSEGTLDVRPEERYLALRVTPQRIDLVDESQGWGINETLDL